MLSGGHSREELALEQAETILNDVVSRRPVDVTTLLRKSLRLAHLLRLEDEKWISEELKGFDLDRFDTSAKEKLSRRAPYRIAKATQRYGWQGSLLEKGAGEFKDDFYRKTDLTIAVTEPCSFLESHANGWSWKIDLTGRNFLHDVEVEKYVSVGSDECARILNQVVNRIFEFASKISLKLRFGEIVEGVFEETKRVVNARLPDIAPNALRKLLTTYDQLSQGKSDLEWSQIAFSCRDIMQDFTDAIFKEEYVREGELIPAREQTKNKVYYALRSKLQGKKERELKLIKAQIDYLHAYFSRLTDYIQKQTHPKGFKVEKEDANRCVIYTYLVIGDLLKLMESA